MTAPAPPTGDTGTTEESTRRVTIGILALQVGDALTGVSLISKTRNMLTGCPYLILMQQYLAVAVINDQGAHPLFSTSHHSSLSSLEGGEDPTPLCSFTSWCLADTLHASGAGLWDRS